MALKPDTSSKSPGVTLSLKQWYRLCDALNTDRDTDIDSVIDKASAFRNIVQHRTK